jgi:hypothetical protein
MLGNVEDETVAAKVEDDAQSPEQIYGQWVKIRSGHAQTDMHIGIPALPPRT